MIFLDFVIDYFLNNNCQNLKGVFMDNLIVTGWGWKDYAIAAAIALRHYNKAHIIGMSTRKLPEFLTECVTKG